MLSVERNLLNNLFFNLFRKECYYLDTKLYGGSSFQNDHLSFSIVLPSFS